MTKTINAEFFLDRLAGGKEPSNRCFLLDVKLNIPVSGVTAIFGHSGSGKTTLLRLMSGLERIKKGRMVVGENVWQDENSWVPPHQRSIGYVFQEASLFPHLTARKNLLYALQRARHGDNPINLDHIVELLGIGSVLDHRPNQLSGGERQRVAIARALLINPALLLMDEPLASLDFQIKKDILPYLERLKTECDIPIIYVSHSAEEVARLADHLVVLESGKVVASGELKETLARVDFPIQLGDDTGVVIDAVVDAKDLQWKLISTSFSGGKIWIKDQDQKIGDVVRLRILARDVSLAMTKHEDSSISNVLSVLVDSITENHTDGTALVKLNAVGISVLSRVTLRSLAHLNIRVGDSIWAQVKSVALVS